jgi:LAS superfamily LD-carboxypeptidase LdcB
LVVAVAVSSGALVATRASARPGQESPSSDESASGDSAIVDINVQVADGDSAGVIGTLDDIQGNVARQLADLDRANAKVAAAQARLDAADKVVARTQAHIDGIVHNSDNVVTGDYVNAPSDSMIETLSSDSANDAMVKQAILTMQADKDAKVLADLKRSRDKLEVQRKAQAKAAARAQDARAAAQGELADLQAATSQQTDFVLAVSDRLANQLAEADALKDLDPKVAAELRQQQAALAAKLNQIGQAAAYKKALEILKAQQAKDQAAAQAAAAQSASAARRSIGPASGSLATVTCPAGLGSITVDSSIKSALQSLLTAAANDGVKMCGGGYRSPASQIALRRAHCGPTNYDIYDAPASACSPPTARPGTSMHEKGLAVDFTCNGGGTVTRSSTCGIWLANHAADYGFHNLPSEAWHYSVDGT